LLIWRSEKRLKMKKWMLVFALCAAFEPLKSYPSFAQEPPCLRFDGKVGDIIQIALSEELNVRTRRYSIACDLRVR
jgi:hypothetical protein